ncbi:MAG: hypothetical protein K2M13_05480 [Muribaculaceae bacterium]|nr:hypothetical protein [Muribaculaceae bacterium]
MADLDELRNKMRKEKEAKKRPPHPTNFDKYVDSSKGYGGEINSSQNHAESEVQNDSEENPHGSITPISLQPDYKTRRDTGDDKEKERITKEVPADEKPAVKEKQQNKAQPSTESNIPSWILFLCAGLVVVVIILTCFLLEKYSNEQTNSGVESRNNLSVVDSIVDERGSRQSYYEVEKSSDGNKDPKEELTSPAESKADEQTASESITKETTSTKVHIPTASGLTSSEAYEIYPSYIPDERIGEKWQQSEVVRKAYMNGEVEARIEGYGTIDEGPFKIEGVKLKNGRLLGRYINQTNGVKLDMNGAYDSQGNLVIRLGHKSETSYFVLIYDDFYHGGDNYQGTWGKANKISYLRIRTE